MRKALGTVVTAGQAVAVNGIMPLAKYAGNPCNGLTVANNAITIRPAGTYSIEGFINFAATAEGDVEIALYNNGVQIPNTAVKVTAAGAGDNIAIPIRYVLYNPPTCPMAQNKPVITVVLLEGPGTTVGGTVNILS